MIKKYCDICKREIDKFGCSTKEQAFGRWFDVDLCEDCKEKFWSFKKELHEKYDKLYADLQENEVKELYDFLGIEYMGRTEMKVEEGLLEDE